MDPGGALSASAQVAITLVGFSGVAAAFGERSVRDWTAFDKFRLRLLLATSSYPTVLSLLGLLALNTSLAEPLMWRILSGVSAASLIGVNLLNRPLFSQYVSGAFGETTRGSRITFYAAGVLGNLTLLLLLVNVIWLAAFWPFFFGIIVGIALALVQFIRLIVTH